MSSTIILSDNGVSSGSAGLKSTAGNDGVLILQTTTSSGTATNAVYVDNKQNIGVQVTPAAWASSVKAIQLGARTSLFQYNGATTDLMNNGYFNGTDYLYLETATATFYRQSTGRHQLYSAASGTAGTAIAWTNVLQVEKDYTLALQGGTSGAGTGISFPATQSASTDANTLDDYEEGLWTPAVGGNATYSVQQGQYVKVGRIVYIQGKITIATLGTGSTTTISGLPFTATYDAGSIGGTGGVSYFSSLAVNALALVPCVNPNTTQMFFVSNTTSGSSISGYGGAVFGNNTRIDFSMCYEAAS